MAILDAILDLSARQFMVTVSETTDPGGHFGTYQVLLDMGSGLLFEIRTIELKVILPLMMKHT